MKINPIQYELTRNSGSSTVYKDPQAFRERNFAGVCEKNNTSGYNAANSGSLPRENGAAAITFKGALGTRILTNEKFSKFLEIAHNHNIATASLIALGLAGVLRPITIMSLPGKKNKEDKIYASGHSIASGVIGFIASTIVTSPLDTAMKMYTNNSKFWKENSSYKQLQNELQNIKEPAAIKLQKAKIEAFKTAMKNIPDWFIAVPRAMLTIALIPPILKYVFGIEKKKKPKPDAQPQQQQQSQPQAAPSNQTEIAKLNLEDKSAFAAVKGGLK